MKITADELARAYRNMPDGELLSLDPAELTDVARDILRHEIERRGIQAEAEEAPADAPPEGWACAGAFRFPDEAQLVQELLDSAGVPARLDSKLGDLFWMGSTAYQSSRVFVPEPLLEQAQSIIESNAVQEEMAAREEAATAPAPVVVLARYENGVFRPLDPVDVPDGTEVEVHLPAADAASAQ